MKAEVLARVDEALSRSRRVIQESTDLSQRRRRTASEFRPLNYDLPYSPYEKKIRDLTEQLHSEENLKHTYEDALKGVLSRLTDIEKNEAVECNALEEQRRTYSKREQDILNRINEVERANRELVEQIKAKALDETEAKLTAELHSLKKTAKKVPKLQEQVSNLANKYRTHKRWAHSVMSQIDIGKELGEKLNESNSRLAQVEHKLDDTIQQVGVLTSLLNEKSNPVLHRRRASLKKTIGRKCTACRPTYTVVSARNLL